MNDHPCQPEDDPDFLESVRLTAYFLWEQDGSPEGRAEEYWGRALAKHRNALTYDRWLDDGQPDAAPATDGD